MTPAESAVNSLGCYHDALAALRLRAVVNGDVFPREEEPIDILLLAAIGHARPDRGWQHISAPIARILEKMQERK